MSDWRDQALCAQTDPDLWFPEKGGDPGTAAKSVCARCPVAGDCLDYAVTSYQTHGVWGGKSPQELVKIRRERGIPSRSTRRDHTAHILALLGKGWAPFAVALRVGVDVAAVYRVAKAHREAAA